MEIFPEALIIPPKGSVFPQKGHAPPFAAPCPKEALKKTQPTDFRGVCLCWHTKCRQDKPLDTKKMRQDHKIEDF